MKFKEALEWIKAGAFLGSFVFSGWLGHVIYAQHHRCYRDQPCAFGPGIVGLRSCLGGQLQDECEAPPLGNCCPELMQERTKPIPSAAPAPLPAPTCDPARGHVEEPRCDDPCALPGQECWPAPVNGITL